MDGVLVIDKPSGITSHDVVAAARRALRQKGVGHTGTLDPLATGVLPLAIGRATRLARFMTASTKDYDATVLFGVSTDSYDVTGVETFRSPDRPTRAQVEQAVASLTGTYDQLPPPVSAKKVEGTRAYLLARMNQPVQPAAVPVTVSRAEVTGMDGDRATVCLTCTAGFYVRSFAHDLGQRLGTGACLEALRRTRSGDFRVDDAMSIEEMMEGRDLQGDIIPLESLLPGFPIVQVTDEGMTRVSHGRELEAVHTATGLPGGTWERVRILGPDGHLIALGSAGSRPGALHPSVVLI